MTSPWTSILGSEEGGNAGNFDKGQTGITRSSGSVEVRRHARLNLAGTRGSFAASHEAGCDLRERHARAFTQSRARLREARGFTRDIDRAVAICMAARIRSLEGVLRIRSRAGFRPVPTQPEEWRTGIHQADDFRGALSLKCIVAITLSWGLWKCQRGEHTGGVSGGMQALDGLMMHPMTDVSPSEAASTSTSDAS